MSKAELLVAFEKARKLEKITAELQEKMACFGKFVGELNDSRMMQ